MPDNNTSKGRTIEETIGYLRGLLESTLNSIPHQVERLDNRLDAFKESQATDHAGIRKDLESLRDKTRSQDADIDTLDDTVASLTKDHGERIIILEGSVFKLKGIQKERDDSKSFWKKNFWTIIICFFTALASTFGKDIADKLLSLF